MLQHEVEAHRRTWAAVRLMLFRNIGIRIAALPAYILLVLAWAGLIATETVVDLTILLGTALLAALGYAGGRLAGDTQARALTNGLLLTLVGVAVFVIKAALEH